MEELENKEKQQKQEMYRHSMAHVLAKAVSELYPGTKFAIGPAIDSGFYYDFELPTSISDADFGKIESKMNEILARNEDFKRIEVSKTEALKLFKNEPYKIELIEELPENEIISVYYTGDDFYDLCRGPHVENTKFLRGFSYKLNRVSGAYWRGSEKNKMLTRIYVYGFLDKADLKSHLQMLEEALKRDHRKLGKELDLFFLDDTAPGMPYWLPKGLTMFNTLVNFWRELHEREGYQEFSAPQINRVGLWKTSGHWEHYKDNMFIVQPKNGDEPEFAVKPMSCPNAIKVFQHKIRSYKDLPLRFNDVDVIHRDEGGGTLHGLLRVQMFRQDDSHNFISEELVEDEFKHLFDLADKMYAVFGLKYRAVLSTRPKDYMGDINIWNNAENILKDMLNNKFGEGNYIVNEGDGAFYGPKIDLWMKDALGRDWQMGTFQFDMQLPLNFGCEYVDKDGAKKTPIIIHRVVYGSLERFIGLLTEHFAGAFPTWLASNQVKIITVSENNETYAKEIAGNLKSKGIRVECDFDNESVGKKIREAVLEKNPYILVLGDKEQVDKTVAVRKRGGKDTITMTYNDFEQELLSKIKNKAID